MMFKEWPILAILSSVFFNIAIGVIDPVRKNEICLNYNGRRIYLEAHEQGILRATNVSNLNNKNVSISSVKFLFLIEIIVNVCCVDIVSVVIVQLEKYNYSRWKQYLS